MPEHDVYKGFELIHNIKIMINENTCKKDY